MKTIFCVIEFDRYEGSETPIKKAFNSIECANDYIQAIVMESNDGNFMNEFYIQEVELCDDYIYPKWIELTPSNKPEFNTPVLIKTYTGEVMRSCYRKSENDNEINLFDCEVDGLGTVRYFMEIL